MNRWGGHALGLQRLPLPTKARLPLNTHGNQPLSLPGQFAMQRKTSHHIFPHTPSHSDGEIKSIFPRSHHQCSLPALKKTKCEEKLTFRQELRSLASVAKRPAGGEYWNIGDEGRRSSMLHRRQSSRISCEHRVITVQAIHLPA